MKLIMIIGGMAQGKHAFAAQFTHARCIDGLAAQIRDAVRAGRDPLEEANASVRDFVTTRESASSDDLEETQDLVLIYPEVGSGVVPLDPDAASPQKLTRCIAWSPASRRESSREAAAQNEKQRLIVTQRQASFGEMPRYAECERDGRICVGRVEERNYEMKLWLIRHGMTKGNQEHRYVGTTDEDLLPEEKERLQARATDMDLHPAVVFVSPAGADRGPGIHGDELRRV